MRGVWRGSVVGQCRGEVKMSMVLVGPKTALGGRFGV